MEYDFKFLEEKGFNVSEGIGFTGGNDKYIRAIQRYYKNYATNKNAVETALNSGDINEYMIKVHALKSNSKMIGAVWLGQAFEKLEIAAKENNVDIINKATPSVLAKYSEYIEILKPIGEAEEIHPAGELSADEARHTADKLLEALDDFDDDTSAELAKKLAGYPFRLTQKQKLREVADYISNFMYDEAAELIKEIYGSIE